MIIGIAGHAGAGKNTVARIFQILDIYENKKYDATFDKSLSPSEFIKYFEDIGDDVDQMMKLIDILIGPHEHLRKF